jgi:hypothetical protein
MLDGDAHMDNQRLGTIEVVWIGLLDFVLENATFNLNEIDNERLKKYLEVDGQRWRCCEVLGWRFFYT